MRYLVLLLALFACTRESEIYICLNPSNLMDPIQLEVPGESVTDLGDNFQLTIGNGDKISIPKALCLKVQRAQ